MSVVSGNPASFVVCHAPQSVSPLFSSTTFWSAFLAPNGFSFRGFRQPEFRVSKHFCLSCHPISFWLFLFFLPYSKKCESFSLVEPFWGSLSLAFGFSCAGEFELLYFYLDSLNPQVCASVFIVLFYLFFPVLVFFSLWPAGFCLCTGPSQLYIASEPQIGHDSTFWRSR